MAGSQDSKVCNLQIGEFCCSLRFKDVGWAASVGEYYQGFLSEAEPDIYVDFEVVPHEQWIEIPSSLMAERKVKGNQFDFHSGLLSGSLDLPNQNAKIKVKYGLLKTARVFEQFFYHLYYTLLEEKYPNQKPNNYLLHACGVAVEGLGYVFTGSAGSGKSTVGQLATGYQVLNDEVVIIGKKDGKYQVSSTPFNGEFDKKVNTFAPLEAVFYLKHGDKNQLRPLKATDFLGLAVKEVVVPTPLHSQFATEDLSKMTDFCIGLLTEVPCYEFHFVPDQSIWKFLEESI
jgi:hypothetical protein